MPLGVFVSRCSGKIDSVVDLETALTDVRRDAAIVHIFDDFFDPHVAEAIAAHVVDSGLDAVVLAGNSPVHFNRSLSAGYLTERIVAAGVNPNRVVRANLLEQVALVHGQDRTGATSKARSLVNIAALRATMAHAIEGEVTEPLQSVLILGATTESSVAAQRLLRLGYSVIMADRMDAESRSNRPTMRATSAFVLTHPNARVINSARLIDADGWLGDFRVVLQTPFGPETLRVGGILLARPDDAEWVAELRQHFKVDIDDDGFARSIDPMTHPAETVDPGIMVIRRRSDEMLERDQVAAADAAAMALILRLSHETVTRYRDVSAVDESLCGGCASCVRTCAFGACSLDADGISHVDVRRCRGCGKCVVGCPVGARDILNSPHDYILEAVRELSRSDIRGDKVVGFLCGGCGYPAADRASVAVADGADEYPASFLPIQIPCGGRLDALYVLEAFKVGFDGVCVYRCREGHCHNLIGNLDMDRRINLLRTVLRSRNIDDSRLRIVDISPSEGDRFIESVQEVYATIGGLMNGKGGAR